MFDGIVAEHFSVFSKKNSHDIQTHAVCVCVVCCLSVSPSDPSIPLPLQDFRDAVAKASRPSGKPIIEEAILNQILYYLPQLYELNQDLLRELEDRVAQWYCTSLEQSNFHSTVPT